MPVLVERIPDEPIIIATMRGFITREDVVYLYQRSAEIAEEIGEHIYRITDTRFAESSFADVMEMLKEVRKGGTASTLDPNVTAFFVGNSQWVKMLQNALHLQQFGGIDVQLFDDLEAAIKHVYFLIASTTKD